MPRNTYNSWHLCGPGCSHGPSHRTPSPSYSLERRRSPCYDAYQRTRTPSPSYSGGPQGVPPTGSLSQGPSLYPPPYYGHITTPPNPTVVEESRSRPEAAISSDSWPPKMLEEYQRYKDSDRRHGHARGSYRAEKAFWLGDAKSRGISGNRTFAPGHISRDGHIACLPKAETWHFNSDEQVHSSHLLNNRSTDAAGTNQPL